MIKERKAHLLIAYLDQDKVFKFLLGRNKFFTFSFSYDPKLLLQGQIEDFLAKAFSFSSSRKDHIEVHKGFKEIFFEEGCEEASTLYFAALGEKPFLKNSAFSSFSFPELLRKLPKTKARVLFLKAFQALSDDKTHLIDAREISDEELLARKIL